MLNVRHFSSEQRLQKHRKQQPKRQYRVATTITTTLCRWQRRQGSARVKLHNEKLSMSVCITV